MSVIKTTKPETPFEVIDRASLQQIASPIALAVWVYLRSKPENWEVREADITEHFGIGRDRYRASIRYLTQCGAIEDKRIKDNAGRIIGRQYVVNYSVTRAPEKPNTRANQEGRAPEKPVRRKTPSDGKSAPLKNTEVNTEDRVNTEHCAAKAARVASPSRFDEFWQAWPSGYRKRDKAAAAKAWKRHKLDSIAEMIIADVRRRPFEDGQWKKGYAPMPSTYLNGKRWEDEYETPGENHANNQPSRPKSAAERGEAFGAACWGEIERRRLGG